MTFPTATEFDNAKVDIDDLEAIVNGAVTVSTRLGGAKQSISQVVSVGVAALDAAASAANTAVLALGYAAPVAYAGGISVTTAFQTIVRSSIVYAPLPASLPFTTSGTWTADDENKYHTIALTDAGIEAALARSTTRKAYLYSLTAAATSHTGVATGFILKCDYFTSSLVPGSGADYKYTGTTTVGKAGNWPDVDGYFYDADGKQFAIVGEINVMAFGAVGDGVTNDYPAIQAAITFVTDATLNATLLQAYSYSQSLVPISNTVVFPQGIFKTLTQLYAESGIKLQGAGNGNTLIVGSAGFSGTRILGIVRSDNFWNWGVTIKGIKFIDNTGSTLVGIYAERLHDWYFEDVSIVNCSTGTSFNGCYSGTASECKWYKNLTAITTLNMTSGPIDEPSDGINFNNCVVHWNGIGYSLGGTRLININGGFIQENDTAAILTNGSLLSTGGVALLVNLSGVYLEANGRTSNKQITGDIKNLVLTACKIAHYLTGDYFIDSENMERITLRDNEMIGGGGGTTMEGNIVLISGTSNLEKLTYQNNRVPLGINWQNEPINNGKTDFVPDTLYASDLDGTGGKTVIQNIKKAFNFRKGTVIWDIKWLGKMILDFPVKVVGSNEGSVTKLTANVVSGTQTALEIVSSNVTVENVIFETDGTEITCVYGDGATLRRSAVLRECKFTAENQACIITNLVTEDIRIESCTFDRAGTAGSVIFLKAKSAFISNAVNLSALATTSTIDTSGIYNKVINNGGLTWTNNGGATNAIL